MYKLDTENAQTLLGYGDIFDGEKPNVIERIKSLNMHKAISIICELIRIRDDSIPLEMFNYKRGLPFEAILKRDFCDIKPKSCYGIKMDSRLNADQHILSLQMLLILLKKIIIYGDYGTLKRNDYIITAEDYREIIVLQLAIVDEISKLQKEDFDNCHFIYSNYHLNSQRDVGNEFVRMYYIMERLSKHLELFKGKYKDYYNVFTQKYGITPTEYSSLLFYELTVYLPSEVGLSKASLWRNTDRIYGNLKARDKISKIIDILKIEPKELEKWAKETEANEWDFMQFYVYPFLYNGVSEYISIGDVFLKNAFFEKMFWMIRNCYHGKDNQAMDFFGKLFERYVQDITKNIQTDEYKYIDEMEVPKKKTNDKSSDAHLRKGSKLLAVEAKGFSVLADCMAKNERVDDNNDKLFINPVLQADEFLYKWFNEFEEFSGVEEIYVIALTLDNIKAVPDYYNSIHKEIVKRKKCDLVKYYFNFSIEEYERLLCLAEEGVDIFSLLREYFLTETLKPFGNFLSEKGYSNAIRTEFMTELYKEATDVMRAMYDENDK